MAAVKTTLASIVTAERLSVASKYTVSTSWVHPQTKIEVPVAFAINADASVPAFSSIEAPRNKHLLLEWTAESQFLGYDTFSGEIGGGHIYIKTTKGIQIKGKIVGGPAKRQSFVGAGTWTKA